MTSPTTNTVTDDMVTRAIEALVYTGYNDETQRKVIRRQATCREYVRAALEAALSTHPHTGGREAVIDWQPIESAPKDGDSVLLWFAAEDCDPWVDKCYWDDAWGKDQEGTWVLACECENSCARPQAYYTHWLPLPSSPPLQKTQKE